MTPTPALRRKLLAWLAAPCLALAQANGSANAAPATTPAVAPAETRLSADDARRDLRILKKGLADLHPGLFRRWTPEAFEAAFAEADAELAQGATRGQLLLLASRLAARVGCGHTWVSAYNQSPAAVAELYQRADKLPLHLRFVEGRFLVTASALPEVPAGAELLAIDGRSAGDIAAALLPYLRADGFHPGAQAKRLGQLSHRATDSPQGSAMDRLFPLRFPPGPEGYRLRVLAPGEAAPRDVLARPLSPAARQALLPAVTPPAWRLHIDGDTATLTLPTFAFWRSQFDAKGFLQRSFDELRARQVPYLVIDLRENEGGDDALGRALLAQLLRQPHTVPAFRVESAYERVPYVLARYLDTWDFGFFDRTGQVRKLAGRGWQLPERPTLQIDPVATPYTGRVIALVSAENSSAGFLVARDLQRSGAATLIGQPTGGSLRGLNGGQIAWLTLPASGVAVDIPLLASHAPGDEADTGVQPEHPVTPRFASVQAGEDAELAAALALIARWREAAKAGR